MKKINGIRIYTMEEVFSKASRNAEFKRGYAQEHARIELARKIRETRIGKKMTQRAVAQKAAMPQSVIARLESGEHGVSVDTLNRVALALGKKVVIA